MYFSTLFVVTKTLPVFCLLKRQMFKKFSETELFFLLFCCSVNIQFYFIFGNVYLHFFFSCCCCCRLFLVHIEKYIKITDEKRALFFPPNEPNKLFWTGWCCCCCLCQEKIALFHRFKSEQIYFVFFFFNYVSRECEVLVDWNARIAAINFAVVCSYFLNWETGYFFFRLCLLSCCLCVVCEKTSSRFIHILRSIEFNGK